MAQALIEFEGDPQPRPGLGGQQADGAQDQVVEIDPAARGFVGLVVVEHVEGGIQQRLGYVSLLQGLHGVAQRVDPLLLSFQSLQRLGVQRHKGLGQQLGENAGFVFARQEQVVIDPPFQPPCCLAWKPQPLDGVKQNAVHGVPHFTGGLRPVGVGAQGGADRFRRLPPADEGIAEAFQRHPVFELKHGPQRRQYIGGGQLVGPAQAQQPAPLPHQPGNDSAEAIFAKGFEHLGGTRVVAGGEADQVPVHRRFEQRGGLAVVEHAEAGLDPGLDREPPEQRLGKGVDGLNVEPARRLQHPREQPPCQRHLRLIGVLTGEAEQRLVEPFVAERDPGFQRLADPVGHLGGGSLGEGQREDLAGLHAFEQQGQQAVGQHPGLAGPGGGRHPRRHLRIGCAALALGRRADHRWLVMTIDRRIPERGRQAGGVSRCQRYGPPTHPAGRGGCSRPCAPPAP